MDNTHLPPCIFSILIPENAGNRFVLFNSHSHPHKSCVPKNLTKRNPIQRYVLFLQSDKKNRSFQLKENKKQPVYHFDVSRYQPPLTSGQIRRVLNEKPCFASVLFIFPSNVMLCSLYSAWGEGKQTVVHSSSGVYTNTDKFSKKDSTIFVDPLSYAFHLLNAGLEILFFVNKLVL